MFYNQNKEFIYMKALRSAGIPLIIVIVAIVVAVVLTLNKPKPEKKELVEKTFLYSPAIDKRDRNSASGAVTPCFFRVREIYF